MLKASAVLFMILVVRAPFSVCHRSAPLLKNTLSCDGSRDRVPISMLISSDRGRHLFVSFVFYNKKGFVLGTQSHSRVSSIASRPPRCVLLSIFFFSTFLLLYRSPVAMGRLRCRLLKLKPAFRLDRTSLLAFRSIVRSFVRSLLLELVAPRYARLTVCSLLFYFFIFSLFLSLCLSDLLAGCPPRGGF